MQLATMPLFHSSGVESENRWERSHLCTVSRETGEESPANRIEPPKRPRPHRGDDGRAVRGLRRVGPARHRALRSARGDHSRVGADGDRARGPRAVRPAALARGRAGRRGRECDERRLGSRCALHLGRQHARGGRRQLPAATRRFPAGARPRQGRLPVDPARGRLQHDHRRHKRRDDTLDLRRGQRIGLRLRVAPLVDRRRHGQPHRRPADPRSLDASVAPAHQPQPARGARAPRGARHRQLDRLPRWRVALSAPPVPGLDLGRAPLSAAGRGDRKLHRRGTGDRRRRSRVDSARQRERDRGRADPRGSDRRCRHQPPHPRSRPVRAQRGGTRARAGERKARGSAGARPHRELGVGHRLEPHHVVGRALPPLRARPPLRRDRLRDVRRADPPGRPRAHSAFGARGGSRTTALCVRPPNRSG